MRRHVTAALLLLAACGNGDDVTFPETRIQIHTAQQTHVLNGELAVTPAQRQRGLMHRKNLPADYGMLFVFERGPVGMWMKNTPVSLDMIFLDGRGRVLKVVEKTEPMSTRHISAPPGTRAVLEVKAGTAASLSIKEAAHVAHPLLGGIPHDGEENSAVQPRP